MSRNFATAVLNYEDLYDRVLEKFYVGELTSNELPVYPEPKYVCPCNHWNNNESVSVVFSDAVSFTEL